MANVAKWSGFINFSGIDIGWRIIGINKYSNVHKNVPIKSV